MLITTGSDLPGYRITRVLGECFGLTVRSRNIGSQLGAGLKSLVGGELRGMTTMLADGRNQAIQRLTEEAQARGQRDHRDALRHERVRQHGHRDLRLRTAVIVEPVV